MKLHERMRISHEVIGESNLLDILLLRPQARCLLLFSFLSLLLISNIIDVPRSLPLASLLLLHFILRLNVSHLIPSLIVLCLFSPRATILAVRPLAHLKATLNSCHSSRGGMRKGVCGVG